MSDPEPTATVPSSELQQTSIWSRILNMYATPGEVFDEVVASPKSVANWLVPMVLNALLGIVFVLVVFSSPAVLQDLKEKQSQAIEQQVKAGKMTEAQAAGALEGMGKIGPTIFKIFGIVASTFFSFVAPLFIALIVLLIASKALKSPTASYHKALEITTLSGVVNIVGSVVTMLLALVKGTISVSPGPALLFGNLDPNSPLFAALSTLNVFYLWWIALLSLGLAKLSKTSFGRAAAWIFGIYFVVMALLVGLAVMRAPR